MDSSVQFSEVGTVLDDLNNQPEIYRPTSFWSAATQDMQNDLSQYGFENFRRMPTALKFFVPTYGSPGSSLTSEMVSLLKGALEKEFPGANKAHATLNSFLDGYQSALADFRAYLAGDTPEKAPYLHNFSESQVGNPIEQFDFLGRKFSRSALNYLMGMVLLKRHIGNSSPKTVLEIGGGVGTLGEILLSDQSSNCKYIDVDIPLTSCIASYYLSAVFGSDKVMTYAQTKSKSCLRISELPSITVINSWEIEKLEGKVDLFVNFISFQEMEPDVVGNYLRHVERLGAEWILLRNMREGKQKKVSPNGVGVMTPIMGDHYLEMLSSYNLIERQVQPFGFQTVDGFHSEILLLKRK